MRMPTVSVLLALAVASCASGGSSKATLPQALAGIWAPDSTVLEKGIVVEGHVLYLTAHGTGFMMGSGPPPLGGSLLAWFDAPSSTLYLRSIIGYGRERWEKVAVFDPAMQTLNSVGRPNDPPMKKRSTVLPKEVLEHRGPELWEGERERIRSLVGDLNRYFPRIGYRATTPREEVEDDAWNGLRLDAIDFLITAEELPLPRHGPQGFEAYRLSRIGTSHALPSRIVRLQRNPNGELSLRTTDADLRTGGTLTRRRNPSPEVWESLQGCLQATSYFDLPLREDPAKRFPYGWIVEGWKNGVYQYVESAGQGPKAFQELCEFLLGLDPLPQGK